METAPLLDDTAVQALRGEIRGSVLQAGDAGYDDARRIWNGMIDRRPGVIVRCEAVEDVIAAVRFAGEQGLAVTVRGGGHGVAGNALSDGGLVIDLSGMKGIRVDPEARTVRAEAGCTLGDLDAATQEHGLAVPLGVVSATGIAGLTLSGGIGYLRRRHGLSVDNLVSVDVVTADGERLVASEAENEDLFWGLRGGGGSFAVATAFEYRAHPVGPEVFFCFVLYPGERTREVLRAVDDFTAGTEDVSPIGVLGRVPHVDLFPAELHGRPFAAVLALHPEGVEGEQALAPLRELGDPLADLSGRMPYVEAQAALDEDYPNGKLYYWKSADLDGLVEDAVAALVTAAEAAPSDHSTIDVWYHGGAMDRVDPGATAFGARPRYLIGVEANWDEADAAEANVAWARATVEAMKPFGSGGAYLNFAGFFEEGRELLRASYGEENFGRLRALKERYDPTNLLGGSLTA
jgi:FAD/FMN-containing dehydrogenase